MAPRPCPRRRGVGAAGCGSGQFRPNKPSPLRIAVHTTDMAQGAQKLATKSKDPKRQSKHAANPKKGQRAIPPKKHGLVKAAAQKKVYSHREYPRR